MKSAFRLCFIYNSNKIGKRQTTHLGEFVFFMRQSKKHEKTNSFLEEVNYYYGSINS